VDPFGKPSESDEFRMLADAGICKARRPEEVRSQWDGLVTEGVIADLQDRRFVQVCARSGMESWSLAQTKVSGDLVHQLANLAEYVRQDLPPAVREWVANRTPLDKPESREGTHKGEYTMYVKLPFVLGESILINIAMCACAALELTPLTDERFHYLALKSKYFRAHQDQDLRDLLATESVIRNAAEGALVREVMRITLPPVGDLPAAKVLELRRRLRTQLDDFRVEMASMAQQIEENPWHPDFDARVRHIVNTVLRPRLRDLRWELQSERDRYWMQEAPGGVGEELRSGWLTSVLTGAPLAGTLVGAGKALVNLLSGWLQHRRQDRAIKRNGLTYLLQLQRAYG
jgi:hypothetical protein